MTKFLTIKCLFLLCIILVFTGCFNTSKIAKDNLSTNVPNEQMDSIANDTTLFVSNNVIDTNNIIDTNSNLAIVDSLETSDIDEPNDSIPKKAQLSDYAIETIINYTSKDSITFDIDSAKITLYDQAELEYETMKINANRINVLFESSLLYAHGVKDSNDVLQGKPIFSDNNQEFECREIKFNFKSKKARVTDIITEEGDGYLHGGDVLRLPNEVALIKNGKYTTCNNHEHPHFYVALTKAKVIPKDKIVSGPAFMVIADVPTPLIIPFAFFPNQEGQSHGIIIPSVGEATGRGFYLQKGGYYFTFGQKADLELTGDIYTRGSWALRADSRYRERYKYNGSISLARTVLYTGESGFPDSDTSKDFAIKWQHNQDPKARPNSRFSANVNIISSGYNDNTLSSTSDYLSNTFQSNISYQTTIDGKYNLTLNASHSQNTNTHVVDVTLPELAFSVNRFYPFRALTKTAGSKWYKNILNNVSVSYTLNAKNTISTIDSLLLSPAALDLMKNGVKHYVPIQSTFKLFKYINFTNSFTFTERWYFESIEKSWNNGSAEDVTGYLSSDTTSGFFRASDFNIASSMTTKIYNMLSLKKGPIKAVRHVMTPVVSLVYRPDFSNQKWGIYGNYNTASDPFNTISYSRYETGIFGSPQANDAGTINFSISNNVELKYLSKKDTTGVKKIVLIENLTVSTAYDFLRDSINWSNVLISGRTKLFKHVDVKFSGIWDPYIVDSTGKNLDEYEWTVNKKLFRKQSAAWNVTVNWNLNPNTFSKDKDDDDNPDNTRTSNYGSRQELDFINSHIGGYVDYNIPWNLNIYYTLQLSNRYDYSLMAMQKDTLQTLNLNGDLSITKKWKIGFTTGWDFTQKSLSYTSIDVYRDLHCWEIVFNWIPVGPRQSYNFTIRAKSPLLQDLKLTKQTDWRDY